MNLRIKVPNDLNPDDVLFSLPYNLDGTKEIVDGCMVVTKEQILIYKDDVVKYSYMLDEFDEYLCEQLVGSSMAVAKKGEDSICLCSFTQDHFTKFAELCRILEFYKRTGQIVQLNDKEEPKCPKCGMPLDEGTKECPYCAKKSKLFLKLVKRMGPYKKYFAAALICGLLWECLWVIMPYFQRIIVDDYITPKNTAWNSFILLGVTIIIIEIAAGIIDYFNMKFSFKVALNMGKELREDVFQKSQELSMKSLSKRTAGELISRVSSDAAKLEDFVVANGKDLIVKTLQLVIITVMLFNLQWKLALLTIIPIPFVFIFVRKLFDTMAVRYTKVWRKSTFHSSTLHDILNGIRVVKSYGNEKREIKRYSDVSTDWAKSAVKADIIWYLTMPITEFAMSIGNWFVLYFGGKMILGETLSLGVLIQFSAYIYMLYEPIRWFIHVPRILADASVSASKVFEILEEETDVKDCDQPVELDIKGDIEFKNVFFGYKIYNPVLKDISCKINQGEMIGVVGHSGVGKSTMINLILRLYDCTQGEILVDGVDIKEISQKSLRGQIGVVLQESYLFDGSIIDNIAYAIPDASFEEVVKAAKIANAHDFITKLPDGYNTRVGNKGYQLSGGERQRIAIARAIIHDPKIIILDEATASLDTQTEKQIQDALVQLTKGRTTIAIAHRLSTLSNADRLIVLDKGKLAEFDTHNNLMKQGGVYYKLVMAQRQTTKMKKVSKSELADA